MLLTAWQVHGDEDVEALLRAGDDPGHDPAQVDESAHVVAHGDVHDEQALVVAGARRRRLGEEVDVEGDLDAMLDDDAQSAEDVRMGGGAVVDVVVVDLHRALVAVGVVIVVVAVCVCGLRESQHRNGEDHQEDQPPM